MLFLGCEKRRDSRGFSLIELMVSIFILSIVLIAMVAVFAAVTRSYYKSKAIKSVTEDIQHAIGLIAKDVRMGSVKSDSPSGSKFLKIRRSRNMGWVCYRINSTKLELKDNAVESTNCASATYNKTLVDLTGLNVTFNTTNSKFYSRKSVTDASPPNNRRGWVEINLDIRSSAGKEMEAEPIQIQTIVSSRDYGWEEVE